jgi:hypothetical protein
MKDVGAMTKDAEQLTDDEKITAYRIARNFQDRPKMVLQKLR